MATLDILGLDPTAPQVPTPVATATVTKPRKPAAVAQPLTASASASSSSKSVSPVPLSGAGSIAKTEDGVEYTVPFTVPAPGSFHRSRWTESQLHLRSAEFTDTKELTVMVGSWNVNAKVSRQANRPLAERHAVLA